MLNKNGWSLKEMLVLSGIIVIFLIITIYYISTFFDSFNPKGYYKDLEAELQTQGEVYFDKYYDGILTSNEVKISESKLKEKLDLNITDLDGSACSYYIIGSKTHGNISVKSYISCSKYTTSGY